MAVQGDGKIALIAAILSGHVDAVRVLLDAGAAVNQADVSEDGGAWFLCVWWLGVYEVRVCWSGSGGRGGGGFRM